MDRLGGGTYRPRLDLVGEALEDRGGISMTHLCLGCSTNFLNRSVNRTWLSRLNPCYESSDFLHPHGGYKYLATRCPTLLCWAYGRASLVSLVSHYLQQTRILSCSFHCLLELDSGCEEDANDAAGVVAFHARMTSFHSRVARIQTSSAMCARPSRLATPGSVALHSTARTLRAGASCL